MTLKQTNLEQVAGLRVRLATSLGDIQLKLFEQEAPKTVENFVGLVKKGYYDGTIFHRVIRDFMIQGGDPTGTGTGGESLWQAPFEDEFSQHLHNFRGALSMANAGPNTNGSQFFIVEATRVPKQMLKTLAAQVDEEVLAEYSQHGGTPWLDGKHTVFGQVEQGMDVVEAIARVKVDFADQPKEPVQLIKATLI